MSMKNLNSKQNLRPEKGIYMQLPRKILLYGRYNFFHLIPSCDAIQTNQTKMPRLSQPATAAINKVLQPSHSSQPSVPASNDVDVLECEVVHNSDRKLSYLNYSFIDRLRSGTHFGYSGPHLSRVACNLISPFQHPELFSENLAKLVSCGRVGVAFFLVTVRL